MRKLSLNLYNLPSPLISFNPSMQNSTQNTTTTTATSSLSWTRALSQHTPLPVSPALPLHNASEHAFHSIASRLKMDLHGTAQLAASADRVRKCEARLAQALKELD